jgi:histidine ammonia-lyase
MKVLDRDQAWAIHEAALDKARGIARNLEQVLAIELLCAGQGFATTLPRAS